MKKFMCVIVAITIVLIMSASASALEENNPKLSELSSAELLVFLESKGIAIPAEYENDYDCIPLVRTVIKQTEENPQATFSFGFKFMVDFAAEIQSAVISHYGANPNTRATTVTWNILQANNVVGSWSDEYLVYNCYAYAIGYDEWIHPGQIEWIANGNASNTYFCNPYANALTMAQWVQNDLECLGHTVNDPTTTMPDIDVTAHHHLICIRKDDDDQLDFHLMVQKADGKWYHKPSKTNPLQYKFVPDSNVDWVYEVYDGTYYTRNTDFTYESEIYFIEYTTNHKWSMAPTGSHQHIRTCSICHQTSGTASSCVFLNGVCRTCGRVNTGGPSINSN